MVTKTELKKMKSVVGVMKLRKYAGELRSNRMSVGARKSAVNKITSAMSVGKR